MTVCKTASQWELAVQCRERVQHGAPRNLEGWGMGGEGGPRGRGHVYARGFMQKTTQYYKVIILQLQIN